MVNTKVGCFIAAAISSFAATTVAVAQYKVPQLQDLVGVRGSSGEQILKSRGYKYVGADKSDGVARSFYEETETGKCLQVITDEGRYQSLLYIPESDCKRVADAQVGITDESPAPGSFKTVCGVIVNKVTSRYLCDVSNEYDNGNLSRTTLRYPDIVFTLVWLGSDKVRMETQGAVPQEATFSTSEGETDIFVSDKTYFYYSDPELAAMEVKSFRPERE